MVNRLATVSPLIGMLSNQKQVSINTYPLDASVDVEFVWHESMITDAPDIHLK